MIVLEDFTDYFFIVSVNPHKDPRLGGGTTVISVQANHSDGRKFITNDAAQKIITKNKNTYESKYIKYKNKYLTLKNKINNYV